MASHKTPITVADGDGIGPEIMAATLSILDAAGAQLDIHRVDIGEKVYLKGQPTGIDPATWETIRHTKAFLKAPITTPQGGGFKSLNVTIRTTLGLYANLRPCVSYYPFVETKYPNMDVVIVRENEEDLYVGVEYHQTAETYHALKLMTRPGCEKIVRYAFEYARTNGRKKVTCFSKDNILKMTDGLFHKTFDEIAKEYPEIENEHWIVDIGAAKLADTPTAFDVIVMPNLYGDILSDVAAQITGSVGLAGSANIGEYGAMFEAIHGSAPRRAGQNAANPSGLLLAGVLMLVHIGQPKVAETIHNAWLRTLEQGIHTYDIFKPATSKQQVGTRQFAEAVISHLGQKPETLKTVYYAKEKREVQTAAKLSTHRPKKETVGVDVFIEFKGPLDKFYPQLSRCHSQLKLAKIYNRGVQVWPELMPETFCVDCWRCRFMAPKPGEKVTHQQIIELLGSLAKEGLDFVHTEHLCTFDDVPGF